jgi:hypothetical protein
MPAGYENIAGANIREGYVVSYVDQSGYVRVVHDVFDSYSTSYKPGLRDFVPVSFTAPPSASDLLVGTQITARAIVDTRDGLLRMENLITWEAGTGTVTTKMTISNKSTHASVRLLNIKRVADVNAGGEKGNTSFAGPSSVYFFNPLCHCRPPIPPGPWVPTVVFSGSAASALNLLAGDNSELFNAVSGDSLIGRQLDTDTQGVLVFKIDAVLPPGASRTATVTHEMR